MTRTVSSITDFDIEHAICHLVQRRNPTFTTIEVVREILGTFISDTGQVAGSSPNALFGKRLSNNSSTYRIKRILPDIASIDDVGNPTTTAVWEAV